MNEDTKTSTLTRMLQGAPDEVRAAASNLRRVCGKYVMVNPLGRGGMGVVWRAWDCRLNRMVALKFLTGDANKSPVVVERLISEARIAARLTHENICQVYDVSQQDGRYYIAMQLVVGRSLDQLKLSASELARVVRKAALALDTAHAQGIIHRDIKPGNIMLDEGGTPYVMDFGIAKDRSSSNQLTQAGTVIGSPAFMSPEQGQGSPVDQRSDVYSLGATLYAGLTGQAPFDGEGPLQVLLKVTTTDPVPPSQLVPETPRELERICLKAMARDPNKRYPSAKALAEELERFLEPGGGTAAKRPTSTRPTSGVRAARGKRPGRSSTVERRSRAPAGGLSGAPLAGATAAGAVVLLGLLYVAMGGSTQPANAPPEPTPPRPVRPTPGEPVKTTPTTTPTQTPTPTQAPPPRLAQASALLAAAEAELTRPGAPLAPARARFELALAEWNQVLAEEPNRVEALLGRARTLAQLFRAEDALRDLERALATQASGPAYALRAQIRVAQATELRCALGWVLPGERGRELEQMLGAAADDLHKAVEVGGPSHGLAAWTAFAENKHEECLDRCDAALAADPEAWELYVLRAQARSLLHLAVLLGRGPSAVLSAVCSDYDTALVRCPGDYYARLLRGHVYARLDQVELALADFQVAIERRPEDPLACAEIGDCMVRQAVAAGRNQGVFQAIQWYERGLKSDPDSFANLVGRALASAQVQDYARAHSDADRAIALHDGHAAGYYAKCVVFSKQGRYADAIQPGELAVARRDDDADAWYELGVASFSVRDWDRARRAWAKAIELNHPRAAKLRETVAQIDRMPR